MKSSNNPELKDDAIVLSVYFCGTGHRLAIWNGQTYVIKYLAGILFQNDSGYDLNANPQLDELAANPQINELALPDQYKMGFDGCGVEYGIRGGLFGTGIDEQCQKVVNTVNHLHQLLSQQNPKKRIIVNCYGHSRGGIAALLLAKMLGHYPIDMVEVNLALLDPVPGNLIISAKLDFLNFTLANQVIDLRHCHNLKRVIALYPYEPLDDLAFHAPIRPSYPEQTLVEEDIVLGCHAAVETIFGSNHLDYADQGHSYAFAAPRFINFMRKCGTIYQKYFDGIAYNSTHLNQAKIAVPELTSATYEDLIKRNEGKLLPPKGTIVTRYFHAAPDNGSTMSFKYPEKNDEYVNRHHSSLQNNNESIEEAKAPPLNKIRTDTFNTLYRLKELADKIKTGMSQDSRETTKGKMLNSLIAKLDDLIVSADEQEWMHGPDEKQLAHLSKTYFRVLVNLCLQRDRHDCGFFSLSTKSRSGRHLTRLLHGGKYQYFNRLVLGTRLDAPHYKDLRSFAGGFNKEHFTAENRDKHYAEITTDLEALDTVLNRESAGSHHLRKSTGALDI